jgi:hypothetical protein
VIEHGQCEHTNAVLWRLTIYLDMDGKIEKMEQEVEVAIPEGIRNGYELHCALEGRKPAQPDANGFYGYTNFPNRKIPDDPKPRRLSGPQEEGGSTTPSP